MTMLLLLIGVTVLTEFRVLVLGSFPKDATEHLGGFSFELIDSGFHLAISIKVTENVAIFQFRYNLSKRHLGVVKSAQFLRNLLYIDRISELVLQLADNFIYFHRKEN